MLSDKVDFAQLPSVLSSLVVEFVPQSFSPFHPVLAIVFKKKTNISALYVDPIFNICENFHVIFNSTLICNRL